MTRRREFNPDSYYHVIMRGNNRQPIFRTKEDMHELKRAFLYVHQRYPFTILAWCFMTNHYHILIKPKQDSLSKIMSLVNRRYSHYYGKRYRHIGRIYQKRFFAKEVASPHGLLVVSSYIHRNPIQTTQPMVKRLSHYPYSSFPFYWNEDLPAPPFLDRYFLSTLLPAPLEQNNAAYCQYCLKYTQKAEEDKHVEELAPPEM
ncbi:transposase [Planococcus sp. ISL-109]|uniref:transposase n=1 Tax=Planococcus sp. ISL-109 TaxID=2819166 RepID=UPI001BE5D552|nr:transposase [Planococcus sp. ISL-109]MBT2581184.1 transposase [Planococcus sp. ISL-109]